MTEILLSLALLASVLIGFYFGLRPESAQAAKMLYTCGSSAQTCDLRPRADLLLGSRPAFASIEQCQLLCQELSFFWSGSSCVTDGDRNGIAFLDRQKCLSVLN